MRGRRCVGSSSSSSSNFSRSRNPLRAGGSFRKRIFGTNWMSPSSCSDTEHTTETSERTIHHRSADAFMLVACVQTLAMSQS